MTGKCRPVIGKCRGVDREMPANDREMPPMTGKYHPLLELVDFDQKLMKNSRFGQNNEVVLMSQCPQLALQPQTYSVKLDQAEDWLDS